MPPEESDTLSSQKICKFTVRERKKKGLKNCVCQASNSEDLCGVNITQNTPILKSCFMLMLCKRKYWRDKGIYICVCVCVCVYEFSREHMKRVDKQGMGSFPYLQS